MREDWDGAISRRAGHDGAEPSCIVRTIEGCDTKPVAKERNPALKRLTENRSQRANMRFILAAQWLREAGADDALRQAIKAASRPNGTLNISRLLGFAAHARWKRLCETG
jgi:hypothetical protein